MNNFATIKCLFILFCLNSLFCSAGSAFLSSQNRQLAALHFFNEPIVQQSFNTSTSKRTLRKEIRASIKAWREKQTNISERGVKKAVIILLALIALVAVLAVIALVFLIILLAALFANGLQEVDTKTWVWGLVGFGFLVAVSALLWRISRI